MTDEPVPRPAGIWLVVIAGCIVAAAPVAEIHLRYREFDLGPGFGIQMILSGVSFAVLVLPITLLMVFLLRRKRLRPVWRSLLILAPVLLLTLPGLVESVFSPINSRDVFAKRMEREVPSDAGDFKAWFSHSPGESSYMFSFRCTAASTEALLAAHPYALVKEHAMFEPEIGESFRLPIGGLAVPDGWPEPKTWHGLEVHTSDVPGGYRFLLTDRERTRVLILVGDT
ncbi:MAG: hypothetical protein H7A49_16605 [Akkermansiaceae bacterium]|nr:hypothetical protein [Akkermansiaceae bacterium]MCP5545518.1 hypothetical protein [Akkermansiaceae bacterium]MCP5545775.1 hypothetical protein [Akkermansiaceae bacterium]